MKAWGALARRGGWPSPAWLRGEARTGWGRWPAFFLPRRGAAFFLAVFLPGIFLPAFAESFTLPAAFWLSPRSGAAVLAEPAIAEPVRLWLNRPGARLILHHAAEDEAQAQAEELRGWLIALGIDASRLELAPDGPTGRLLRIEVTPAAPVKAKP